MKQNDLVTIRVFRGKTRQYGKKKIPSFYTPMMIVIAGEEEKGKQRKNVTLKFVSDIDTKNITSGRLTCVVKDIGFPRKYEVVDKLDEDGNPIVDENGVVKKDYPCVWIRAYKSFEEIESEVENPFLDEEPETEETDIEDGEFESEDK